MPRVYAVNHVCEGGGEEEKRRSTFYTSKSLAIAHARREFDDLCDKAAKALTHRLQWEVICDAVYRDGADPSGADLRLLKSWGLDPAHAAINMAPMACKWLEEERVEEWPRVALVEIEIGPVGRKHACSLLNRGGAFFEGFQDGVKTLAEVEVVMSGRRPAMRRTELVKMTGRRTFSANPGGHHAFKIWDGDKP